MTKVGVGGRAPTISTASRRQADLLVRLAQRGRGEVGVLGVAAAARERDLAGVALEVVAALGEDELQLARRVEVERGEHGGLGAAVDVDRQRGLGRQQRAAQLLGECGPGPQASSTRSSKMTSPSSVRWTGHLAAITLQLLDLLLGEVGGHPHARA